MGSLTLQSAAVHTDDWEMTQAVYHDPAVQSEDHRRECCEN